MSAKPEPSSEHSSHCHVLNVQHLYTQMTSGMWDTYSLSQKEEMSRLMEQVIAHAIDLLEAEQALLSSIRNANN